MERIIYILFIVCTIVPTAQSQVSGHIYKYGGTPLAGATVSFVRGTIDVQTDSEGKFIITNVNLPDTLIVRYLGYQTATLYINENRDDIKLMLLPEQEALKEVLVSTGYQQVSKVSATGAYSTVTNEMLNRSVSPDIMSRLEGITSSLSFDSPRTPFEPAAQPDLRVRGLSTIAGNTSPLIVVDGFPYESDILNINPNDVENITVLKDAAAASIWGARAGNGVIVITTKTGDIRNRPQINLRSTLNLGERPDLFYAQHMLSSPEAVELEKELFARKLYIKNDWTTFTPVVETLFMLQDGEIDEATAENRLEEFKKYDIRNEASALLYQKSIMQQHAVNIAGGNNSYKYYLSSGLDKNRLNLVGDDYSRISLNSKNDFRPTENLLFSLSANIVQSNATNNGVSLYDLNPRNLASIYTYARLRDNKGNALPLVKNNRFAYTDQALDMGLLDWHFRPLDEMKGSDNTVKKQEVRVNSTVQYRVSQFINAELRYQYLKNSTASRVHYNEDSYFARNLINQFTQADLSKPIPLGGILDRSSNDFSAHYGRAQVNFSKVWRDKHSLHALTGIESRQEHLIGNGSSRIYGYDDNVLASTNNLDFKNSYSMRPNSSGRLPQNVTVGGQTLDRFVSYYGNFSYDYQRRYMLSGSLRRDASNIFGVDFNQKGVPLWSIGAAWSLSNEQFWKSQDLSDMKLRLTYGSNGNVVPTLSSLPHMTTGYSNAASGVPAARLRSVGNPDLSWEKVSTLNFGVDFSVWNNRLRGVLDIYQKKSSNLIGYDFIDPTTGVIGMGTAFNLDNRRNYADMNTNGFDIEITSRNLLSQLQWQSSLLISFVKNKVTNYYTNPSLLITEYFDPYVVPVVEGNSKDQMYALPWAGLDHKGDPLVPYEGQLGNNYNGYFTSLEVDDLIKIGNLVPTAFGSLMNKFTWRNISLSANVVWKAGYVFRRESISYSDLFGLGKRMHSDYLNRWKMEGDETRTNVPSMPEGANLRRDQAYLFSEALVEKGDHVRLQDVSLSYTVPAGLLGSKGRYRMEVFGYAKNIGILWKRTNYDIDPDVKSMYPQPLQIAFGLNLSIN